MISKISAQFATSHNMNSTFKPPGYKWNYSRDYVQRFMYCFLIMSNSMSITVLFSVMIRASKSMWRKSTICGTTFTSPTTWMAVRGQISLQWRSMSLIRCASTHRIAYGRWKQSACALKWILLLARYFLKMEYCGPRMQWSIYRLSAHINAEIDCMGGLCSMSSGNHHTVSRASLNIVIVMCVLKQSGMAIKGVLHTCSSSGCIK